MNVVDFAQSIAQNPLAVLIRYVSPPVSIVCNSRTPDYFISVEFVRLLQTQDNIGLPPSLALISLEQTLRLSFSFQ